MSSILHLSDTHFGTERSEVVEALLRLATRLQPDLAIVSGDITQRARQKEFAAAASFFEHLSMPKLILPGNHDIPFFNLLARVLTPYRPYTQALGRDLSPVLRTPDMLVIGVNTTRPWRQKDGAVSATQVEQVSQQLQAATSRQLRIVVTHQPIHVIRKRDESNRLHGHTQAIEAWSKAGADLILGGHIHLPYVQNLREAYPALTRSTWVVQAGTALSTRIRFKTSNSVNLIRYKTRSATRGCEVERWDFDDASGEFVSAACTTLELDNTGSRKSARKPVAA